jgi:anti-anti-sigma regulatory factor
MRRGLVLRSPAAAPDFLSRELPCAATPATVTLDLRRLEFMDCRGMTVVIEAATRAREDGSRFLVVSGPPAGQPALRPQRQ